MAFSLVRVLSEAVLVLIIASRADKKNPQMTQMAQISEKLWWRDDNRAREGRRGRSRR